MVLAAARRGVRQSGRDETSVVAAQRGGVRTEPVVLAT